MIIYPPNAIRFFKQFHSNERILKEAKEGDIIVLKQGEEIIGTGTIIGNHVFRVFVNPMFHRQGFGKMIMNNLEAKARSNGLQKIILDVSLPSVRFYESLGYDLYENASIDVGDGKTLDYYKAKKLLNNA